MRLAQATRQSNVERWNHDALYRLPQHPAKIRVQAACRDTLPWLISFSLDRMHHIVRAALLIAVSGCVSSVHAHVDTIIQLRGNNLVGLPPRYAPAEFDTKTLRLKIGTHSKELSPWLKGLFELPHDLEFSASWYHERSPSLPPYLLITISPKHKDFRYGILVALETLDLLSVYVDVIESRMGDEIGNYREFTQQMNSNNLSTAAPK